MSGPYIRPIWTWCGGEAVVAPAVDDLLYRARLDPELHRWLVGPGLCPRDALQAFVRTALGGPGEWSGPLLEPTHQAFGITTLAFRRFGGHLLHALASRGVHPEVLALVVEVLDPLGAHIAADGPGHGR